MDVVARIVREHHDGRALSNIARGLAEDQVPTARGGRWHAATVKAVLASTNGQKAALRMAHSVKPDAR